MSRSVAVSIGAMNIPFVPVTKSSMDIRAVNPVTMPAMRKRRDARATQCAISIPPVAVTANAMRKE